MSVPQDDQDGLANKLRNKCSREYTSALNTPFMVSLAAGTLEKKTYQYYLFQGIDYGKTCIQVAEKAKNMTNEEDAKGVFDRYKKSWENLVDTIKKELEDDTNYDIHSATEDYKQHLLDTVDGKIEGQNFQLGPIVAVFTLGAILPCLRLYAYLGQNIVKSLDGKVDQNNPYKDWIESNAKESLEEKTRNVEALLNKLCEALTVEELEIIEKLYCKSMKHEIEFFLAPKLDQPTVLPLKSVELHANVRLLVLSGILADIVIVTESSNLPDLIEIQSSYDINRSQESATDKVQAYRDILKKRKDEKEVFLTVYIGSSLGDLLCLLQANIGIVIEAPSSRSLFEVGRQLGVSFEPLFPSLLRKQKAISATSTAEWKELSGVIYTVNSGAEIDAFIFGWEN